MCFKYVNNVNKNIMMVCFEKSCRLCLEDYSELKYPEPEDKITELLNKLTILFPTLVSILLLLLNISIFLLKTKHVLYWCMIL